jgi:hypothetical protein
LACGWRCWPLCLGCLRRGGVADRRRSWPTESALVRTCCRLSLIDRHGSAQLAPALDSAWPTSSRRRTLLLRRTSLFATNLRRFLDRRPLLNVVERIGLSCGRFAGDGETAPAGAGPLRTRRGHPDLRAGDIDYVTMAELTSSPVLARSVDRDLAGLQDGPHVTTRVDQAGELHQLAQADRGSADLHTGLDRLAGWIAGHHQTVSRTAPQYVEWSGLRRQLLEDIAARGRQLAGTRSRPDRRLRRSGCRLP